MTKGPFRRTSHPEPSGAPARGALFALGGTVVARAQGHALEGETRCATSFFAFTSPRRTRAWHEHWAAEIRSSTPDDVPWMKDIASR
ncbi:hypothetical protein [Sorangium sp. So ce1335]|uniref:hypothetical protein n=1 Tax=Sorangium sp. So ce1335 TaxID=3133335 RepID=UPI003F61BA78